MDMLDEAKRELTALLRQRHRLADYQDDDFETRDPTEFMNTIGSTTKLMTVLLTIAASISLLVGGIGIMNIMLVSVTERIKEIGLRMAIGATPINILGQFILESVILSTVGGAIGVALGVGLAIFFGNLLHWPIEIDTVSAAWSLALVVRGHVLRLLSGLPRLEAQPHRLPALRVATLHKTPLNDCVQCGIMASRCKSKD